MSAISHTEFYLLPLFIHTENHLDIQRSIGGEIS